MENDIEAIKEKLDIVEFISGYLQLKKAGVNYKALCPFHSEKTPSFMVSPDKQIWHCFGCNRGGTIFDFLMEMEGMEFPDALKILADRAGIPLKQISPKIKKQKDTLIEINESAAIFFHYILTKTKKGKDALLYLKKRGLKDSTIAKFQIGYAPDDYDLLQDVLVTKKGYKDTDMNLAGLLIKSEKPKPQHPYFSRFRGRIMFPICDIAGNVVAFSGRIFPDKKDVARYLNSPDTPIYNKSQIIYGLNFAKEEIKKKKQTLIVEGQMDLASAHQAGFTNAVATSGTALTLMQLEKLKKFAQRVIFCFDRDSAGEQAAKRAIGLAQKTGLDTELAILPKGYDPDLQIKEDSAKFKKILEGAIGAVDYYFRVVFDLFPQKNLTPEQKREIASELLPIIKNISDPITQGDYLKNLAKKLETEERYLYEALTKIKIQDLNLREIQPSPIKALTQNIRLSEQALGVILLHPQYLSYAKNLLVPSDFADPDLEEIYKAHLLYYTKNSKFDLNKFKKTLPQDLHFKIDLVVTKAEHEFTGLDPERIEQEVYSLFQRLRSFRINKIKKNFEEKITEAEKQRDRELVKKLIRDFQNSIIKENK